MLGVYVTVPVACFRKGLAREYLETEPLPPPATCYGFLLSLVGETQRRRHVGCRVAPVLLSKPPTSVVLRTVWRVKKTPLGSSGKASSGGAAYERRVTRNASRRECAASELLAVLLLMELFGFVDPFVPLDSVWGGVELLRDLVDILWRPARNLDKGM